LIMKMNTLRRTTRQRKRATVDLKTLSLWTKWGSGQDLNR
jgi:hypothetical protein